AEPRDGLRRYAVTTTRHAQQLEEGPQLLVGRSGFVRDALALGAPYGPLSARGMEAVQNFRKIGREIEIVQAVGADRSQSPHAHIVDRRAGSQLHGAPAAFACE